MMAGCERLQLSSSLIFKGGYLAWSTHHSKTGISLYAISPSWFVSRSQCCQSRNECPGLAAVLIPENGRVKRNDSGGLEPIRLPPFGTLNSSHYLIKNLRLTGLTLWEYLDERYPGDYPYKLLRTLQRRVKHWRATQGPENPIIFRQSIPPGQQGLSDFTHPRTPITISGQPFAHLIYQYRLAHSGWRCAYPVRGGESYSALAEGLQRALHKSGGVPVEHRTDSLSAAYVNQNQKKHLTRAYEGLCEHYGMIGTTNNPGRGHENGAIETSHGSIKAPHRPGNQAAWQR